MDPISIESFKKQKQDEVDRISRLPDALILHIFSFLTLEDSVRTSVLSSRWEDLWMSIPNFNFCLGQDENIAIFVNFVDRSMSLCESSIKQFSLCCHVEFEALHLRRWITAAIRRNVEDLFIESGVLRVPFNFPKCLFASQSLTKLSLSMYYSTLKCPPLTCLPNLKHLNLELISFTDEESAKVFFSGCPALETLRFVGCYWSELHRVCICAPKLRKLEMYDGSVEDLGMGRFGSCDVMISGPSLKCFHYGGIFINNYSVHNSPSLDECSIEMEPFDDEDVIFPRLCKLLKGIAMVKKLSLSTQVIKTLGNRINLLPDLPIFRNLSVLSFGLRKTDIGSVALMKMLQNSPCLEILRFEMGIKLSSECKEDKVLEPVPPCFLSCLKRIELSFDRFYEDQKIFVDAAKILLARAAVLEKLTIYDGVRVPRVLNKELMELPRASQVCEMEFCESMASTSMKPY